MHPFGMNDNVSENLYSNFDIDPSCRIGIIIVELMIPGSQSLKSKRFAIKSIKERLRLKFNVSVAEIGYYDLWQRSKLAIVTVSNDYIFIEKMFAKIYDIVSNDSKLIVIDINRQFL